jgi:cytochrome c-type biogenesis protein CcmH/NrfG
MLLAACAQAPTTTGAPDYSEPPAFPDEPGETAPSPTAALLEQSRRQSASSEYSQAAASVERALRIEPGNPWLWLELAQIHQASGNVQQAKASAAKALSLSGPNRAAEERAREILEQVTGP